MPFVPPDPTQPPDSAPISQGAAAIRAINAYLLNFLGVSFDVTTGEILASAIPNGLPTPYGAAGTVLTSAGPGVPPTWNVPGNLIPGLIMMFGNNVAPAGWLKCDGAVQLITAFPGLAGVLGTTFGGDGVTTFGLPDLRGRSPIGLGTGTAPHATPWTLGLGAGDETHLIDLTEMPSHTHALPWAPNGQWQNGPQPAGQAVVTPGIGSTNASPAGGASRMNIMNPVIGLNFIIKT